jgi:hypothetical protein
MLFGINFAEKKNKNADNVLDRAPNKVYEIDKVGRATETWFVAINSIWPRKVERAPFRGSVGVYSPLGFFLF